MMNDCPDQEPVLFKSIKVSDYFSIPCKDDDDDVFQKLRYNKARNIETLEVSHFVDETKVWIKEHGF